MFPLTNPYRPRSQAERFRETARQLECDEDCRFEAKLKRIEIAKAPANKRDHNE